MGIGGSQIRYKPLRGQFSTGGNWSYSLLEIEVREQCNRVPQQTKEGSCMMVRTNGV